MATRKAFPSLTSSSIIGITNRGEPALRFIRATREYNAEHGTDLKTAVFFLDEEADALFVREADIAVAFHTIPGASQTGTVYLQHRVLADGLEKAGCDAVWPGWGFVSEDAGFAELIESLGKVFLGPGSKAMAKLGDKIAAKEMAANAGVPILPWSKRPIRDLQDASEIAAEIGYPVIVKAANAGGGRGIRFVYDPDELDRQFASAREETLRVTGGDVVFIERLVTRGRHLEVQCICDRHGNVHTLGVRDCSVQRRNQKIIEETPPPGLSADQIAEIEGAAGRLMAAADYVSAGTVEFLYDLERSEFYFMEVNTRLQVEHPITEVLYGFDLVKGQISVGFGHEIVAPASPVRGWVMEARLNAEDPDGDFAPSPGVVKRFRVPLGPGIRVDSGIGQGSIIPAVFDSMVGKIISSGNTRSEAIGRLQRALKETRVSIDGGTTNKAFLLELLAQPEIQSGAVHTKFVEEMLESGSLMDRPHTPIALIAGAIDSYGRHEAAELVAFRQQIANFGYPRRAAATADHEVTFGSGGNVYTFKVKRIAPTVYQVLVDGIQVTASSVNNQDESRLDLAGKRYSVQTVGRGDVLQVEVDGTPYVLRMESGGAVKAPSPAVVLSTNVSVGETVEKGQRLLSLEAMKMEMIVEAPSGGVIGSIAVKAGQQVTTGDILVQLDTADDLDESKSETQSESRLSFPSDPSDPHDLWDRRAEALSAIFLGYDRPKDPLAVFDSLADVGDEGSVSVRLFDLIYRMLEACLRLDSLFSTERIHADQFARAISWQELIFIYFQYSMTGSESVPIQFTESLQRALRYYPSATSGDGAWNGFFSMYRAQRDRKTKDSLIRSMLFTLERLPVPPDRDADLLTLLNDLIHLSRLNSWPITDAALHARYELYDRVAAINLRNRRRDRFQEQLRLYLDSNTDSETRDKIRQSIVDTSGYAEFELLQTYHGSDGPGRAAIVELVARRTVRDRSVDSCRLLEFNTMHACVVSAGSVSTLVLLCAYPEDASKDNVEVFLKQIADSNESTEVQVLVAGDDEAESIFARFEHQPLPVSRLSVGLYRDRSAFKYRTFHSVDGSWCEDRRRRGIRPLFYRELRLSRLSEFEIDVVYQSEAVCLLLATARTNPRDQRLIAFGSASESEPELDPSGRIERVNEFDEVFLEAVHKMRSFQSRRDRRLMWNRIVVHVRALTPTTAVQIKDYGNRIIPETTGLGLEKAIIYTRRKRWSESVIRELELLFLNISEDQFTLRSRKPSAQPLQPMDRYVSNVVRNRQRGVVYPYELIKLITFTGYPVSLNVPRGEFEEYDITIEAGESRTVSVKGRPYGENTSNVVFGIVKNQEPTTEQSYRRVLILSDATSDMGSLAEGECRRVIAAFEVAEELQIPVEWIPISSGARIDMESGTENLDWTAAVLRKIVQFTQAGGEVNIIVSGINVGAQSYWNAEATMLMHTSGLLIMTDEASMLLTGKKALDFSGSVSGDTNTEIGGVEKIMGPNGQAQVRVSTLAEAYSILFAHYRYTYRSDSGPFPDRLPTSDDADRDIGATVYEDRLGQGFRHIADIFSAKLNPDRKKPFDMRQVMKSVIDTDTGFLERWGIMNDAETAIIWETRVGGFGVGLIGIESRPLVRIGDVPFDGPETWSGGTLFPSSSKKVARAINAWSGRLPVVVLANLSGFDGSPESLRRLQLEYGAEIGRAVVNFRGPIVFVVVARYHGGAYVVFSRELNENLTAFALEGSFASVLGGAPAAAVVFPRLVEKSTREDQRVKDAAQKLASDPTHAQRDFDEVYRSVYAEKQTELGIQFDKVHNIQRAKAVGSIHDVISVTQLRSSIVQSIETDISAARES